VRVLFHIHCSINMFAWAFGRVLIRSRSDAGCRAEAAAAATDIFDSFRLAVTGIVLASAGSLWHHAGNDVLFLCSDAERRKQGTRGG